MRNLLPSKRHCKRSAATLQLSRWRSKSRKAIAAMTIANIFFVQQSATMLPMDTSGRGASMTTSGPKASANPTKPDATGEHVRVACDSLAKKLVSSDGRARRHQQRGLSPITRHTSQGLQYSTLCLHPVTSPGCHDHSSGSKKRTSIDIQDLTISATVLLAWSVVASGSR